MGSGNLRAEIQRIKELDNRNRLNEEAIKQIIVVPILRALGWDTLNFDEVNPEYPMNGDRVDYALLVKGNPKVLIEVKSPKLGSIDVSEEQLLKYAFKVGSSLAVLTDGFVWKIYLPVVEESWRNRVVCTFNMTIDNLDTIVSNLKDFIERKAVIDGRAVQKARDEFEKKRKEREAKEVIPRAFLELVNSDEIISDLLQDYIKNNYSIDLDLRTISEHLRQLIREVDTIGTRIDDDEILSLHSTTSRTYKKIKAFAFKGKKYEVKTWKELLVLLSKILYNEDQAKFLALTKSIRGTKRLYFSNSEVDLRSPEKIAPRLYVETHFSAIMIENICRRMIEQFGYKKRDLVIYTD